MPCYFSSTCHTFLLQHFSYFYAEKTYILKLHLGLQQAYVARALQQMDTQVCEPANTV